MSVFKHPHPDHTGAELVKLFGYYTRLDTNVRLLIEDVGYVTVPVRLKLVGADIVLAIDPADVKEQIDAYRESGGPPTNGNVVPYA